MYRIYIWYITNDGHHSGIKDISITTIRPKLTTLQHTLPNGGVRYPVKQAGYIHHPLKLLLPIYIYVSAVRRNGVEASRRSCHPFPPLPQQQWPFFLLISPETYLLYLRRWMKKRTKCICDWHKQLYNVSPIPMVNFLVKLNSQYIYLYRYITLQQAVVGVLKFRPVFFHYFHNIHFRFSGKRFLWQRMYIHICTLFWIFYVNMCCISGVMLH